jgi:hypothetical protein
MSQRIGLGGSLLLAGLFVLVLIAAGAVVLFAQDSGMGKTADNGEPVRVMDRITEVERPEFERQPQVPSLLEAYMRYSADTFVPYDSSMTWGYAGAGCVYRTGGAKQMNQNIQLPQGAQLDHVRLYFYDNDTVNDAALTLLAFDGLGGAKTLLNISSAGAPGQSSVGWFVSPAHQVDNEIESLSLRINFQDATTNSLQICGVQIRYQYGDQVNVPVILFGAGAMP